MEDFVNGVHKNLMNHMSAMLIALHKSDKIIHVRVHIVQWLWNWISRNGTMWCWGGVNGCRLPDMV